MEKISKEKSRLETREVKQEFWNEEVFFAIFDRMVNRERGVGDYHRIGLADLGGGLMGVQSAGMLTAFELLGIRPETFDEMVGSSAGAVNLASYRAGQTGEQTQIYYEFLSKRKGRPGLIHLMNVKKPIDIKKLLTVLAPKGKSPLDLKKLLFCPGKFEVVVTNIDTREPEYLPVRATKKDISVLRLMHATAAVQGMYGRILHINGNRYIDGSFVDIIPIEKMKNDGLTHALILPNYGLEEMKRGKNGPWYLRALDRQYYSKRLPEHLRDIYLNYHKQQRKEFEDFKKLYEEGKSPESRYKIAAIEPVFRTVDHMGFRDAKKSLIAAIENCMMTVDLLWKSRESYVQRYPEQGKFLEKMRSRKPTYEEVIRALTTKRNREQRPPGHSE